MGYNPKNHRYWMTIKKNLWVWQCLNFVLRKVSFCGGLKNGEKWCFYQWKKKSWTAPTLQGNVFLPLKQKPFFCLVQVSSLFFTCCSCYNFTVLQAAKKPMETVLILQYFKRVWYREINKTTVLQKRETYLMLLTFLLWFKLFPTSFALSRSLTASCQPLQDWSFLLNF